MNFKVIIDSESWFYTHWRSVCHSVSVSSGVNAFAKPLSLLLSLRSVCNQGKSSLSSPSPWFGFESEYCHHVGGFPLSWWKYYFPLPSHETGYLVALSILPLSFSLSIFLSTSLVLSLPLPHLHLSLIESEFNRVQKINAYLMLQRNSKVIYYHASNDENLEGNGPVAHIKRNIRSEIWYSSKGFQTPLYTNLSMRKFSSKDFQKIFQPLLW